MVQIPGEFCSGIPFSMSAKFRSSFTYTITVRKISRFQMKLSIVAGGGTLLGLIFGFIGSFAFRTHFTDHYRLIEPLLMFSICYLRSVKKSSEIENYCAFSDKLHSHVVKNLTANPDAKNRRIDRIPYV